MPRSLLRTALVVCVLGFSETSLAGGPIGSDGEPITTSSFAIDLAPGPVLGGSRTTALGGAYVAIAEDVDGDLQNPAAPAVRPFYSVDWFDWWLGLGLTFPALSEMDYFNTGADAENSRAPSSFLFLTPALNLQWGTFGVGTTFEIQHYAADAAGLAELTLDTTIATAHLQFAESFLDGQLAAGLGTRTVSLSLVDKLRLDGSDASFRSNGLGTEMGILIRPNNLPFRVGASYRSAIETRPSFTSGLLPNADGDLVVEDEDGNPFYYPSRVSLPWDANFGAAYQFGRPFNPVWRSPSDLNVKQELILKLKGIELEEQRERALAQATTPADRERIAREYDQATAENEAAIERSRALARVALNRELAQMQRFYILLTGALYVAGHARNAIGVESYFNQVVQRSGQQATFSPRFGIETEAIPDLLKLRVGSYLEPTRVVDSSARAHVTFGFDVRLTRFDVFGLWPGDYLWRIGFVADTAPRYATWGLSLGGWYPRHRPQDLPAATPVAP